LRENGTPNQDQPTTVPPSKSLGGEIVGIEGERIRVRLETGTVGFLAEAVTSGTSLRTGQQGTFRVLRCNESGEMLLGFVSIEDDQAPRSFEHAVNQLQDALNHHHATPIARDEAVSTMDEQRIQDWLNRVDKSLEKLRRNRSKRLNEEFYTGS
jgi:hypothetical protein